MKKKLKQSEKYYSKEDPDFCFYEVFRDENESIYYLNKKSSAFLDKIVLDGYTNLPSGLFLNRNGYGFGKKGMFLVNLLKNFTGEKRKLNLILTSKKYRNISETESEVKVTLPAIEVGGLLHRLGKINEENNKELRNTVNSFLSTKFPKKISTSEDNFDEYKGGEVANLLKRKSIQKKLNAEDLVALQNFFPSILRKPWWVKEMQ